jgi:hypothetical protein
MIVAPRSSLAPVTPLTYILARPTMPKPSLPPHKWTAEANEKFLILIIQMYPPKINYADVAARMDGVTEKAVKNQFLRLKTGTAGRRARSEKGTPTKKKIPAKTDSEEELDKQFDGQ